MRAGRLSVIAVVTLTLTAMSSAQQIRPEPSVDAGDVDFWVAAALNQIHLEQPGTGLALLNETLPAAAFSPHLRYSLLAARENVLVDKALARNRSKVSISIDPKLTVELVDAKSLRSVDSDFDLAIIGRRFGQQGRRLVRLSLPVFSDDGTRALVFSETGAGFDNFEGRGYIFEREPEGWVVVDYLYLWIN